MRGDHPRADKFTKRLLELEGLLKLLFRNGYSEQAVREAQTAVSSCQATFSPSPFTSKDIDHCMQGLMLEAGLSIFDFVVSQTGDTSIKPDTFRASVAVYYEKHGTIVLKTSSYWPTRCSVTHPHFSANLTSAGIGERSVLRLAMLTGKVICCESTSHFTACAFQFDTIEFQSASALAIPIFRHNMNSTEYKHFLANSLVCSRIASRQMGSETDSALAGLCLESPDFFIDQKLARGWLSLTSTQALLRRIGAAAAHYLDERVKYRMVLYMSCLAQLSQGILRGREVHRVLLRAISNLAGGPDVTLHLCDLISDKQDERRAAARIVSAFGPRVRGFLLTERYSGGLVGKAIEQVREQFIGPEEIKAEVARAKGEKRGTPEGQGYRQILPGTEAEFVVPIVYYERAIGAVNLEWADHTRAHGFQGPGAKRVRESVLRAARYYSLVVDYHDDHKNPLLNVDIDSLWNEIDQLELNRQTLRYYIGGAYETLRERLQREAPDYSFLQPIAQVVGYLNPFRNRLRVKVSIRKANWVKGVLIIVAEHGLAGTETRGDIAISSETSILARVARCACPIFGEINSSGTLLSSDSLCEQLMPEEIRRTLDARNLPCTKVCDNTVYEIALPLVFGGEVLGTLDIEFFDPDRDDRHRADGDDLPIRPQMLSSLLDWARAISFLMALEEDKRAGSPYLELESHEQQVFDEFLEICLSVLAYVPVREGHVQSMMNSYLNAIARVGDIKFRRSEDLDRNDLGLAFKNDQWIWTGTNFSGIAEVLQSEKSRKGGGSAFLHDDRADDCQIDYHLRRLAACLISANWSFTDRANVRALDFLGKIQMLANVFPGEELRETDALSVNDFIAATMLHLHRLLEKYLAPGGVESGADSSHGWFIYCGEFDSSRDASVYRSGTEGARLAFIGSKEFRDLWERISKEMPGHETFDKIMQAAQDRISKSSFLRQLYADMRILTVEGRLTVANFAQLISETLAARTFDRDLGSTRSLTLKIAERCTAEIVHDLSRNPNRSSDYSEWFFGENPYSLVGIPVVLLGRCVAVVQLLRRRSSRAVMDFFSQQEFDAVCTLGKQIEGFLSRNIESVSVDASSRVPGGSQYVKSDINRLSEKLENERIRRILISDVDMQVSLDTLKADLEKRFPEKRIESLEGHEHSRARAGGVKILDCRQLDLGRHSRRALEETLGFVEDGNLGEQWIIVFGPGAEARSIINALIVEDHTVEAVLREEATPDDQAVRQFLTILSQENNSHFKRQFKSIVARRKGPNSLKSFAVGLKGKSSTLKVAVKQWLKRPPLLIFADWLEAHSVDG